MLLPFVEVQFLNSELSVELPLNDENFASLQENNLKIWDFHNKVKEGAYNEFYFVNNNVLFKSIVDNGHKFKARVIPVSLMDVVFPRRSCNPQVQEHACPTQTYACLVKYNGK